MTRRDRQVAGPQQGAAGDCERCEYPEVAIGDDQPVGSPLHEGTRVLAACIRCGASPVDNFELTTQLLDEAQAALDKLMVDRDMLLYHWAPITRRKQIIRFGLRPSMRPTTNASLDWKAPHVCLADDPSWAWLLSGAQRGSPAGDWDLWQTWASRLEEPHIVPGDVSNGIHEVRTSHRIFKRDLWLVGTRTK